MNRSGLLTRAAPGRRSPIRRTAADLRVPRQTVTRQVRTTLEQCEAYLDSSLLQGAGVERLELLERVRGTLVLMDTQGPKRSRGWDARTYTPNDVLWRELIKTRDQWACRRCERSKASGWQMQAAHIFMAGKPTTRCDEDNGLCLCARCHDWAEDHDAEFKAWARELLGAEGFDRLEVRSNLTRVKPNDEEIRLYLKQRIAFYRSQQSL